MPRSPFVLSCLVLALGCPLAASAGDNATASIRLSWNSGASTTKPRFFPLFVNISNAADLEQLTLRLTWTPHDCYRVFASSESDACNRTQVPPTAESLAEVQDFTWTHIFPPGAPSSACLLYWVQAVCKSAPAPEFHLTEARALDSAKSTDLLAGRVVAAREDLTSIDERSDAAPAAARTASFSAHPNPVRDEIELRFERPEGGYTLAIYDLSGKVVLRAPTTPKVGAASFRWNLRGSGGRPVPPGLYFARLSDASGVQVQPIVVLK